MTAAILIGTVLFFATLSGHCLVLRAVTAGLGDRMTDFLLLCGVLGLVHMAEVGAYALGFAAGEWLGIGSFENVMSMDAMDTFYFSLVNFTTLGLGSVLPTGHLRFIAGIEAFNGFLCISMSASALFKFTNRLSE